MPRQKRVTSFVMETAGQPPSAAEGEWFKKALADPDGEYADYFYFVKGKDGREPSNYRSYFGGNAWEPVPGTDKYYLHMFAKEQPDLNWENPVLRQKIYDMVNWWLAKGLAGFRIDAIINIKKDTAFPSFPPDGDDGLASCVKMVEEVQGVGALLEDLKHATFEKWDAFTVAEVFNMKEDELPEFIGDDGHFSTMFDFSAHELTYGEHGWYDSKPIEFKKWRDTLFASQLKLQKAGFAANIIENHDEPRGASRYLPEHARNEAGKKMLGTTSILLRGIPFIYQGQEIGMTNCIRNDISEYDDISTKDQFFCRIQPYFFAGLSARRISIRLPLTRAAAGRRHCAAATRTAGTMPERRCSGRMMRMPDLRTERRGWQ